MYSHNDNVQLEAQLECVMINYFRLKTHRPIQSEYASYFKQFKKDHSTLRNKMRADAHKIAAKENKQCLLRCKNRKYCMQTD